MIQDLTYETIFDNEWATIRYQPASGYLYHTIHKPIGGDPLREMMYAALGFLIQNHVTKWLSDDRLNAVFSPADVQEASQQWAPQVAAAGWKFWALVVPEDIAARASMIDLVEAFFNLGVRVAIFTEVDEARRWLVAQ